MANVPITREELKPFMERSDAKAGAILLWTWGSIVAVFALAAMLPYWPVYLLAIFLLAGRQQALAALMHEAGHNTFFKTKKLNELTANWLTAPFILMDGKTYSKFHLLHHKNAGTKQDPDLPNYQNYPVTKLSLARKFLRDFTGVTGVKMVAFMLFTGKDPLSMEKRAPFTLTKSAFLWGLMFVVLYVFGYGVLFLLWVVAYLTVYLFIVRFRQIAEHAGVMDLFNLEPKYNTRSIPQGILGFLFFAPTKGLSYHCEHHAFMAVPTYHLKSLHELLKQRGYYDDVTLRKGYWDLFPDIVQEA